MKNKQVKRWSFFPYTYERALHPTRWYPKVSLWLRSLLSIPPALPSLPSPSPVSLPSSLFPLTSSLFPLPSSLFSCPMLIIIALSFPTMLDLNQRRYQEDKVLEWTLAHPNDGITLRYVLTFSFYLLHSRSTSFLLPLSLSLSLSLYLASILKAPLILLSSFKIFSL